MHLPHPGNHEAARYGAESFPHSRFFTITDSAWLVPHRQAHSLGFIKLWILKRGKADQAVGQGLRKLRFFKVQKIGLRDRDR